MTLAPIRPLDTAIRPTADPAAFRSAFRRYAAGVVVITTAGADGRPAGFTATSLASVSLEPPLVSFALSTSASSWPAVAVADAVVVNFLDASQHRLATRFATSGIDRFAAPVRWSTGPAGEPHLDDAPLRIRAEINHRLPVGDHHIVVARVTDVDGDDDHAPLVYVAGGYGSVFTGHVTGRGNGRGAVIPLARTTTARGAQR